MSIKVIAVRLTKGDDLKQRIANLVSQHQLSAGTIISCVGSLSTLNIRLAGAQDTLSLQQPLEIVSMMGTLTPSHQHIHLSVADARGHVVGGHLLDNTYIDTTAELIIHAYEHLLFDRTFDHSTGYSEWVIQHVNCPKSSR